MKCLQIIAEPANRGITIVPKFYFLRIHNVYYRSRIASFNYIKNNYGMIPADFWFKPFSPFYEEFKAHIEQLVSVVIVG